MLATLPFPSGLGDTIKYEEVKSWNNDLIFVRNGTYSGLLDQSLQAFVKPEDQILNTAFFGVTAATPFGTRFHNANGQTSKTFQQVTGERSLGCRQRFIVAIPGSKNNALLQSLHMIPSFCMVRLPQDSNRIVVSYFSIKPIVKRVFDLSSLDFVQGKDGYAFLMVDHGERKTIYDHNGQKLFSTTFDKIQYAGHDLFICSQKGKARADDPKWKTFASCRI